MVNLLETVPNLYCTLGGDLIENVILNSKGDIFKQTMTPHQQMDKIISDLKPVKHKILAITTGNHEDRTYKQTGFDYSLYLAKELGLEDRYSYYHCVLFVSFGKNQGRKGIYYTFSISLNHGSGGSTSIGGKINKLVNNKIIISNCDVYVNHHTHEPISTHKGSFYADTRTKSLQYKEGVFVNSSSFLDYGGYALQKGYAPSSIKDYFIILSVDETDRIDPKKIDVTTKLI